jgi:DNA-binding SARP family transcriptional activator
MEFGVLGPLRVIDHDDELTPSATKQRQMLALLLLTHGHVVPVDMFIEELWDGNPTPTALASVHTYTMQLRRMFCNSPRHERTVGAAGQRLVTLDRAYRLDVRPRELDIDAFNERVNIGRTRLACKEYEAAAEQLGEALDLWQRGPALPDVVAGPVLYPAVRALEVTRLEVLGQRIWAELHLGRHYELVSELASLHCQHPTNEMFATQFMLALHRSGRRAEALEAFHRHRAALREELGLTPPPQLHELYTDILRNHPRLDVPTHAPMAERPLDLAS